MEEKEPPNLHFEEEVNIAHGEITEVYGKQIRKDQVEFIDNLVEKYFETDEKEPERLKHLGIHSDNELRDFHRQSIFDRDIQLDEKGYIKGLSIDTGHISEIPDLPDKLVSLRCTATFGKLAKLPKLPPNLEYLYCNHNVLTELTELPKKLRKLCCSDNNLNKLPLLPQNLEELECDNNKLKELPDLPQGLKKLWCRSNPLSWKTKLKIKKHKNAKEFWL